MSTAMLAELLALRSARRGHFVLASGRTSELYIDARLTTMSPEGLATIGPAALSAIRASWGTIDAVGGLTLGADPIAYAIAYASTLAPPPVRAFSVRKEAKTHGTTRQVEGPLRDGDRIVIIEDVITTGGSALRAVEVLRTHDVQILGVLALVDREEGGREAIEGSGLQVVALTRASEIIPLIPPGAPSASL
jgi:orotate phosphoribosyltransferase